MCSERFATDTIEYYIIVVHIHVDVTASGD